jgi:cysteine-rich repeat protein
MSKGSMRLGAPWAVAAVLGAGVASAGACGGVGGDELFNSGATSGTGAGGAVTTSTMVTSTGQGGDSTSTGVGPGGAGGSGGGPATSSSTGGPLCGDGIQQVGEQCDMQDFGMFTCKNFDFTNPDGLVCTPGCKINFGLCKPTCDGQKVEPGEVCDGAFLDNHTCVDLGYSKGDGVKCTACQLDGAGCKATCGDGKLEPTEQCDDGNTTPGDGCDATCHIEPTGPGSTCASAIPVTVGLGSQDVSGSTVNGGDHTAQGCTSDATDRVYAVKATANGFLTANLVRAQTSFDSVLYLGTGCSDANANTTLLCNDSHDPQNQVALNGGEVVSIHVQQGQTVFVFVDGVNQGDSGTYQIHFDLSSGLDCNDPVPIPLEIGTGMTVRGSTANINAFPVVQGSCGGQPGGQVVYAVTRAVSGPVDAATVNANTSYNSVLYARSMCGDGNSELACSNNQGNAQESFSLANVNGGTPVFVWVDGSVQGGGNASGNYGVTFTP